MKLCQSILIVSLLCLNAAVIPCIAEEPPMLFPSPLEISNSTQEQNNFTLYAQESASGQDFLDELEDEEDLDFLEEEEDLEKIADPLEPVNRFFFHFNDKLYFWLIKPVAEGYSFVVPEGARIAVSNFFDNIATPVRVVNSLLQFKIKSAGTELARFGINSTFGMLGLYDVAKSEMGITRQDEDFGQTLGTWGIGPVIYINWPVLGPSSVRDSIGFAGDYFLNPVNYVKPDTDSMAISFGKGINNASLSIGDYEELKKDAIDPYSAVRDVYYQYREGKIKK